MVTAGERRMEAENYLAAGYALRAAMQERAAGWRALGTQARIWQPDRLKGIQVAREYGTPFLAATQVFDLQPVPRKFLSLHRTEAAAERFVRPGTMLVTCSGSVGRATLAYRPHEGVLISHDLLRIEPEDEELRGWLYAFLRSSPAQAMMVSAQYGHIIKHLEVGHLASIPVPDLPPAMRDSFNNRFDRLLATRNESFDLRRAAEKRFAEAIGTVKVREKTELGFERRASLVFGARRRLEAGYHSPVATAILRRFAEVAKDMQPLRAITERVWWMTRFKRVFGDEGVPYISADELFSLNPRISKRVLVEQADNADEFFVKVGWLVMACSGQVYGLNGSVALATKRHEGAFFSHDLVRIVPNTDQIHPGYLFIALSHPELGRPLVIRNAYGTSIPHLDPADVADLPVVRLGRAVEKEIGDAAQAAVEAQGRADEIEDSMAAEAERVVQAFLHRA